MYFTCAKWPLHWISNAEVLAHKVWTEQYKKVTPSPAEDMTQVAAWSKGNDVSFQACFDAHFLFLNIVHSIFQWQGSISMISKTQMIPSPLMLLKGG
jgi:hypothetical protein